MKYKIFLTSNFLNDLENITDFYKDKSLAHSIKLLDKAEELVYSLDEFPERFATIQEFGEFKEFNIRQCVCDNYKIIYQIKDNCVYALAMLGHNQLDFDKLELR